jgi:short-subunit dehydrogenase
MEMAMAGQFAIVTGASTGIGYELARLCAAKGYDLLVAADEPEIETVAQALRNEANSSAVVAVQADLATVEGVDKLYEVVQGRKVDLLMANAGRGLSYLNSFSFALREELRDTKVTVTCLMPGATETEFFAARTCSIPKSDPKTKMTPPWSPAWALRR